MKLKCFVALVSLFISLPAIAQNQTYACQHLKSAGLIWKKNYWEQTGFRVESPFFLKVDKGRLSKDSVSKAIGIPELFVECNGVEESMKFCFTPLGSSLIFDTKTMTGGISSLYGATLPDKMEWKDSLSVSAFTCTKM